MNLNKRRTTLQRKSVITLALATALAAGSATAADTWYVGATGGLTNNGVSSLNLTTDGVDGRATADADNGYTMGAVFGREFDSRWRLEGEFRYRTNEFASVDLPDGSRITDGDFSSGALGVNGYWLFGEVDAAAARANLRERDATPTPHREDGLDDAAPRGTPRRLRGLDRRRHGGA